MLRSWLAAGARWLRSALALGAVTPAALAQDDIPVIDETDELDFDDPQSWAMQYFGSVALFTPLGAPVVRDARIGGPGARGDAGAPPEPRRAPGRVRRLQGGGSQPAAGLRSTARPGRAAAPFRARGRLRSADRGRRHRAQPAVARGRSRVLRRPALVLRRATARNDRRGRGRPGLLRGGRIVSARIGGQPSSDAGHRRTTRPRSIISRCDWARATRSGARAARR